MVLVIALVAGAAPLAAVRLGASMTLLQFAIGSLNDVVDAPRDRGTRTGKPIADGIVEVTTAQAVFAATAIAGLLLAVPSGLGLVLVGAVGFAIGAWYDLRAKGTVISWMPIALGVPLLPVFAWFGATGSLPASFAFLVPAAALAGAALAIGNAAVDAERDAAADVASVAVALGPRLAAVVALLLQVLVGIVAVSACLQLGASGFWLNVTMAAALLPAAGAFVGVVVAGRGSAPREVAFEVQAVALALLAVAWINAVSVAAPVA